MNDHLRITLFKNPKVATPVILNNTNDFWSSHNGPEPRASRGYVAAESRLVVLKKIEMTRRRLKAAIHWPIRAPLG